MRFLLGSNLNYINFFKTHYLVKFFSYLKNRLIKSQSKFWFIVNFLKLSVLQMYFKNLSFS